MVSERRGKVWIWTINDEDVKPSSPSHVWGITPNRTPTGVTKKEREKTKLITGLFYTKLLLKTYSALIVLHMMFHLYIWYCGWISLADIRFYYNKKNRIPPFGTGHPPYCDGNYRPNRSLYLTTMLSSKNYHFHFHFCRIWNMLDIFAWRWLRMLIGPISHSKSVIWLAKNV